MKRKCRPSGRKQGKRCVVSPLFASKAVTGVGVPPESEMRNRGVLIEGAKTITPSRLQEPPRGRVASASVSGGPPEASTLFSFPPEKNPMLRLSGDQNGDDPPSVPGKGCACNEFKGRTQRTDFPSSVTAANTKRVPSGESANPEP